METARSYLQLLVELKNPDPTAITAREAIVHLLGLGHRLVGLERRRVLEFGLSTAESAAEGGADPAATIARFQDFLERSVALWNPNKERATVRLLEPAGSGFASGTIRELLPGGGSRQSAFGHPSLLDPSYDHLAVGHRDPDRPPAGLGAAFARRPLEGFRRAELYSVRWRAGTEPGQRREWTEAIATVQSRRQGLLLQPQFQIGRIWIGPIEGSFGPLDGRETER